MNQKTIFLKKSTKNMKFPHRVIINNPHGDNIDPLLENFVVAWWVVSTCVSA
jgi:hypothetical protein